MNPILLDIPSVFSTDRLMLRVPRPGDGAIAYPAVCESLAELKPWMPWATDDFSLEKDEEWCRKAVAEFAAREALHYFIFVGGTSEFLGTITAKHFSWDVPRYEIGYWLRTTRTGQGYMTEAAGGLMEILNGVVRPCRVEIRCDVLNQKSRRLAERLAFNLEGILRAHVRRKDGSLRDTCIYAWIDPANQRPSMS